MKWYEKKREANIYVDVILLDTAEQQQCKCYADTERGLNASRKLRYYKTDCRSESEKKPMNESVNGGACESMEKRAGEMKRAVSGSVTATKKQTVCGDIVRGGGAFSRAHSSRRPVFFWRSSAYGTSAGWRRAGKNRCSRRIPCSAHNGLNTRALLPLCDSRRRKQRYRCGCDCDSGWLWVGYRCRQRFEFGFAKPRQRRCVLGCRASDAASCAARTGCKWP